MNTLIKITKHSLVPLLLGGLIYVLFRSQSLIMFGWVNAIGMYELINLLRVFINADEVLIPNWFIYSLPDGLWIYSFTSALITVNGCKWNEYKVWLLLPIGFGIGVEFLQLLGLFKGTFDVNDLLFYFIGIVSSVLKLGKINKKINYKYFKMKKNISAVIGILFITLAFGSGDSEDVNKCDTSSEGYRIGYEIGEKSIWDTPEEDLRMSNNGFGNIGEVPPCWEEGFRDAKKAKDKEQ